MTAYTATQTGLWSDPTTWGGSGFPEFSTDSAVIGNAYTVTLTGSYSVFDMELDGASALNISGGDLDIAYIGNVPNNSPTTGLIGSGGTVNLSNGGELEVDSGVGSASVSVNFVDGSNDLLVLNAPIAAAGAAFGLIARFASPITNFVFGDAIVLENAVYDPSATYTLSYSTNTKYKVSASGTAVSVYANRLNLPGTDASQYTFGHITIGGTTYLEITVVCFLAGTHLLTDRGEVAVEDLREGDMMVTFSGRGEVLKPVTWIGQLHVDLTTHADPDAARPVRIRAGAFGQAIPHRDLLVSPDHAIYVDGVLIPAKHLINGTTIVADTDIEDAHYFHIELEDHDVLLAEGLTAESYLDTGNRNVFAALAPRRDVPRDYAPA